MAPFFHVTLIIYVLVKHVERWMAIKSVSSRCMALIGTSSGPRRLRQIWNRITGNTGADAQVAQAAKFNEIDTWTENGWWLESI